MSIPLADSTSRFLLLCNPSGHTKQSAPRIWSLQNQNVENITVAALLTRLIKWHQTSLHLEEWMKDHKYYLYSNFKLEYVKTHIKIKFYRDTGILKFTRPSLPTHAVHFFSISLITQQLLKTYFQCFRKVGFQFEM